MTCSIKMTGGVMLCDDDMLATLSAYTWSLHSEGYAQTRYGDGYIFAHQMIIGKRVGMEIDHKNHNRLDNRRRNLRHLTHAQNGLNRSTAPGVRTYVCADGTVRYYASIKINQRYMQVGVFSKYDNAARAVALNRRRLLRGEDIVRFMRKQ